MPFIDTVAPERAEGLLRRLYDAAVRRAGKVFAVIRIQSLQPRVLEASTELYLRLMHARDEPLSRAQRELLASYVSMINACEY
ncbi:MAG: carboxymuconolactone decarboxylase family protein [Nannocystaceae bacterium]|nr:carboxymuconolactone decarboxylase family protein [Nannocystaceae bacterium]